MDTQQQTIAPADELTRRREEALAAGGPEAVAKIHDSGRQTARERVEQLIDPGSWYELGMLAEPELRREDRPTTGDGIVTGLARVGGRKVAIIAIETTVLAGTTAPVNMRKQNRVAEWAGRKGIPLICISDNDGGRLPDLLGWRFSGVPFDFSTFLQSPPGCPAVPHMTAVLGPSFGDAALHAAMGNFVVMHRDASVALSGPPVIRAAIGEDVDATELGGPIVAAETSGSVHMVVEDEKQALDALRRFLTYLPDSAAQPAPVAPPVEPKRDPEQPGRDRPARAAPRLRHAQGARLHRRRRLALPLGRALRPQPHLRARAHRGPGRGRRGQPADAARRRAGRARAARRRRCSSTSATRSTCRWCSSRTCPG